MQHLPCQRVPFGAGLVVKPSGTMSSPGLSQRSTSAFEKLSTLRSLKKELRAGAQAKKLVLGDLVQLHDHLSVVFRKISR